MTSSPSREELKSELEEKIKSLLKFKDFEPLDIVYLILEREAELQKDVDLFKKHSDARFEIIKELQAKISALESQLAE